MEIRSVNDKFDEKKIENCSTKKGSELESIMVINFIKNIFFFPIFPNDFILTAFHYGAYKD